MTFDRETQKYIPSCYAILTAKSEQLYCNLFHELMEYTWMPSVITVDFENSLISAVKHEFQQSPILGCYFHLKQAIFRKLKKITQSSSLIKLILDYFELLTLIPINEISLDIESIKIKTINDHDTILFLAYFQKTWIKKYIQHYGV
ncbi:hypothetical protein HZS_7352 [Henneguya salminicola]|nr:hypothetical protein HZS_7352 [Henneguya salminicola]